MPFRGSVGQRLPAPKLFRTETIAEAVAEVLERQAPTGRRKYAERRFKLAPDAARRAVEARASRAILDHMFRVGGWGFVLEVFAIYLDHGVDQHLARESRRYAENASRLSAIGRDLRAVADRGLGLPLVSDRMARARSGRLGETND